MNTLDQQKQTRAVSNEPFLAWRKTETTGQKSHTGLEKHTDELIDLLKMKDWSVEESLNMKRAINKNELHEILLILPQLIDKHFGNCNTKLISEKNPPSIVCIIRTNMDASPASQALFDLISDAHSYSNLNNLSFEINFV